MVNNKMIGLTGCVGLTGPNNKGYTGYNGLLGLTGISGNIGSIGYTGITGTSGENIIGPIGPQFEGSIGNTGEFGPSGYIGGFGDTGINGNTGPIGQTGGYSNEFVYIGKTTLSSDNTTISITNIPACSIIKIKLQLYQNGSGSSAQTFIRFNNDTGNNYTYQSLEGLGIQVGEGYSSNVSRIQITGNVLSIPYIVGDYNIINTSPSIIKCFIGTTYAYSTIVDNVRSAIFGAIWNNTSQDINRIDILTTAPCTYLTNSSMTLYGVLK